MAESAEHFFLKTTFLEVLKRFSTLELYGYTESDRKMFDFSCLLERDWSRPLVGQVLWSHWEGVEKDIRTLIHDNQSEIKPYVLRDSIKARQIIDEILTSYRSTNYEKDLFRLKLFWVPQDFDADKEDQQRYIHSFLSNTIVQDILFNVVFGNITNDQVLYFLSAPGTFGLNLAVLYEIGTHGFFNIAHLAKSLEISAGPVREKLLLLRGIGFITSKPNESYYLLSQRGKLFLDLVHRLVLENKAGSISSELEYFLKKLGCSPTDITGDFIHQWTSIPFAQLLYTIKFAVKTWGCDFFNISYVPHHPALREMVINKETR